MLPRLRTAAYRAFRLPTLNEYYRPFRVGSTVTEANPALKLETLDGAEIGDSCIDENGVELAESVSDGLGDILLARDIAGVGPEDQSARTQRLPGLLDIGRITSGDGYAGALGNKTGRRLQADASRSSRNQGFFSFQT